MSTSDDFGLPPDDDPHSLIGVDRGDNFWMCTGEPQTHDESSSNPFSASDSPMHSVGVRRERTPGEFCGPIGSRVSFIMSTYSERLKDPRWQRKRLEIFERDGFACRVCGDTKKELQVHHIMYLAGLEPWNYPGEVLVTLCVAHHEAEELGKHPAEAQLIETLRSLGSMNSDLARIELIIRELKAKCGPTATLALIQFKLDELWTEQARRLSPLT